MRDRLIRRDAFLAGVLVYGLAQVVVDQVATQQTNALLVFSCAVAAILAAFLWRRAGRR